MKYLEVRLHCEEINLFYHVEEMICSLTIIIFEPMKSQKYKILTNSNNYTKSYKLEQKVRMHSYWRPPPNNLMKLEIRTESGMISDNFGWFRMIPNNFKGKKKTWKKKKEDKGSSSSSASSEKKMWLKNDEMMKWMKRKKTLNRPNTKRGEEEDRKKEGTRSRWSA